MVGRQTDNIHYHISLTFARNINFKRKNVVWLYVLVFFFFLLFQAKVKQNCHENQPSATHRFQNYSVPVSFCECRILVYSLANV